MTDTSVNTSQDHQEPESQSQRPIGCFLQAAREQAGMTIGQVASSMRLTETTVERLESESGDFSDAPVYLRGYIKNYAKLLGVELPESFFAKPVECEIDFSTQDRGEPRWRRTADALARRSAYLVATALVVGTLLAWLYDPSQPEFDGPTLVTGEALDRDLLEDAARLLESEEPARRAQAASMTPLRLSTDSASDARAPVSSQAPVLDASALSPPDVLPIDLLPSADTRPSDSVSLASAQQQSLLIRAHQDSWVQIENNDQRLMYGLLAADSERQFPLQSGDLNLLLGFAPGIELSINGEPIDLAPHTSGNVARFQLAVDSMSPSAQNGAP